MKKHTTNERITRIEKRAIEAQAIAPVIEAVAGKLGIEEARAILQEVNRQEAYARGRQAGRTKRQRTIEELARDVGTWGEGGAWRMEVLEQTPTTYFFNVHRCPYYEAYKAAGVEGLGVQLSCCRDEPFARGLDPNLRLVRTQTIMEGAPFCDFRYYLES